jgi:dihydropteroate synthase
MLCLLPLPLLLLLLLSCALLRAMRDDSELVHIPVSVDTYHARVAEAAVAAGADMVNDVTGGLQDPAMLGTVARLGVPYCLMHMRGELSTMTQVHNIVDYLRNVSSHCFKLQKDDTRLAR